MATQKVILLTNDGNHPIGYNNPEGFYGPMTGAITSTLGLFPLESLTCRQFDLYFQVNAVSGTFSTGQGLIVALAGYYPAVYNLTPPLTSTGQIVIHYRDGGVTAEIFGFSNIPNQVVSLDGMYPQLPTGTNIPPNNTFIVLIISGTSPSFGIDAWILCRGE